MCVVQPEQHQRAEQRTEQLAEPVGQQLTAPDAAGEPEREAEHRIGHGTDDRDRDRRGEPEADRELERLMSRPSTIKPGPPSITSVVPTNSAAAFRTKPGCAMGTKLPLVFGLQSQPSCSYPPPRSTTRSARALAPPASCWHPTRNLDT